MGCLRRSPGPLTAIVLAGCGFTSCVAPLLPPSSPVQASPVAPVAAPAAPPAAPTTPPLQFQPPSPPPAFAPPDRRARLSAAFPELDAFVAAQVKAQGLPSLALGVVIDGDLAHVQALGNRDLEQPSPVSADTVYRIGSITKTFTAAAILRLRDEGKLALDDPAVRYLPELGAVKYPTRDSPPITLRHLLTHASGLPRVGRFNYAQGDHDVTESELLNELSEIALGAPPGMRPVYSNFGVALLGTVIKRVTGVRYRDYVSRTLLTPLGMTATRWAEGDVPPANLARPYLRGARGPEVQTYWRLGESEAAGGLFSSLRDMARYAAFQLAAYPPRDDDDRGPVRRASLREAHTVQRPIGLQVEPSASAPDQTATLDAQALGIGLAWHTRQTCAFEQLVAHNGGTEGFASLIQLLPERGVAVVALANYQNAELDAIVDGVWAILSRSGGLVRREQAVSPALAQAIGRTAALYDTLTEPAYAALFSPEFRAGVPFARAAEAVDNLRKIHGACAGRPQVTRVDSPLAAHFRVACARGEVAYDIELNTAGLLSAANATSQDIPPPAALTDAAGRVAALIARWDDASYDALLAPAFPRPRMQTFFRDLGARHGACVPTTVLDADGQTSAAWRLTCRHGGDRRLELTADATTPKPGTKGARIAGIKLVKMRVIPLPAGMPRERCPEHADE